MELDDKTIDRLASALITKMAAKKGEPELMPFRSDLTVKTSKGEDSVFARLVSERAAPDMQWLRENLVLGWITGSHLYGTETPTSDMDYVGVVMPPIGVKFGLQNFEEAELSTKKSSERRRNNSEDIDLKLYSFDKFVRLALDNNPNIIELLFAPERCILYASPLGRELMSMAPMFLNMRVAHAFSGYAYSQLKRLQVKKENMTGRKELAEEFGYDVKFMSHAFRLLYEGIELMREGHLDLPLREHVRIVQIKTGFYKTVEEGLAAAEELIKAFEMAKATSVLPHKPDFKFFNDWLVSVYSDYYFSR